MCWQLRKVLRFINSKLLSLKIVYGRPKKNLAMGPLQFFAMRLLPLRGCKRYSARNRMLEQSVRRSSLSHGNEVIEQPR